MRQDLDDAAGIGGQQSDTTAGEPAQSIPKLCETRREALPPALKADVDGMPLWGLALSGGGIRSATFCFGLLRALAGKQILHRFDILSTVSGGGYVGSTVGKLYHEAQAHQTPNAAAAVEDAIGHAETRWFTAWLRANGRYLIPRGGKDVLFAITNFGRNLLGVHIELAVLSLLLGGLLVGFDLAIWQWADCLYYHACSLPDLGGANLDAQALLAFVSLWPTPWLLLPFVVFAGGVLTCAYWATPTRAGDGLGKQPVIAAVAATAAVYVVLRHSQQWGNGPSLNTGSIELPTWLVILAVAFAMAWVLGAIAAGLLRLAGRDMDAARYALTRGLAAMFGIVLAILVLGVADYLAWSLGNVGQGAKLGVFGVALAALTALLRAVVPKIADLPKSLTPGTRRAFMTVLDVAGMVLAALVAVFWISLMHRAVSVALFSPDSTGHPQPLQFGPAWQWMAWIFVPALVYAVISFANREFLNRSSLLTFYRGRLVRSYLGAGNASRFSGGAHPLDPVRGNVTAPVTRRLADDDVPMASYAPHLAGGPVHLLNVCINQTHDPRGALFNQDRKGLLLTVGPRGQLSYAPGEWCMPDPDTGTPMTLGGWMAISGAAVAPGLGASTRTGVAAIVTMAGLRLGCWWNSQALPGERPRRQPFGKYGQLVDELLGRFDGEQCRDWYLSDGGHFENTAAYALLREECGLVVVADCGADPRYAFGDLENLVRKARIDLQADITFLRPRHDDANPPPEVYGSLNDLASAESQACLALARIDYRHSNKVGYMFIVKPNMCQGVSVDLVNFKADNPLFPQEPTTDQMFSEAQWESYFQLGKTLGSKIDLACLLDPATFAQNHFVDDDGAILVRNAQTGTPSITYASKRLSSRIASTGVVSASVSFGAVMSFGLAALQAVNKEIDDNAAAVRIDPAAFRELTDIFGKLPPSALLSGDRGDGSGSDAGTAGGDDRLGEMATALLRFDSIVCTRLNAVEFRRSPLMRLMLERTKLACLGSPHPHPSCTLLTRTVEDDAPPMPCLQATPAEACVPMYWTRDYSVPWLPGTRLVQPNCPPATAALAASNQPPAPAVQAGAAPQSMPSATAPATAAPGGDTPASAPPAASAAPPSGNSPCKGQTVYVQIYGPEMRDSVRQYRAGWRALGASVPPLEDVWDTARRAGRRLPTPYQVPTVLFRNEDSDASRASEACARRLVPEGAAWDVKALPRAYSGKSGVVEVWIPPSAPTNGG